MAGRRKIEVTIVLSERELVGVVEAIVARATRRRPTDTLKALPEAAIEIFREVLLKSLANDRRVQGAIREAIEGKGGVGTTPGRAGKAAAAMAAGEKAKP